MLLRILNSRKPSLMIIKKFFSGAEKAPQQPFLTSQQIKDTLPA